MVAQAGPKEKFSSLTLLWIFMLSGKATFTIRSERTSMHFTYQIVRKSEGELFWFISVLTGRHEQRDFSYLGCFAGTPYRYVPDRRLRIGRDAMSRQAFEWLVRCIDNDWPIEGICTIWHEGRCGRCGHPLTTPESIRTGLGPVCKEKALE